MAHDPHNSLVDPHAEASAAAPFPLGLWVLWTLSVIASAVWVAWPALRGLAPLDTLRLVITSALVGLFGLLLLTVVEIRLAPWRFLD
jgi:hypothetical protein